jgi:hypothetical protein
MDTLGRRGRDSVHADFDVPEEILESRGRLM